MAHTNTPARTTSVTGIVMLAVALITGSAAMAADAPGRGPAPRPGLFFDEPW